MTLFRLRSSSNSSWVRIHASKSWCLCHKRISKHQYLSREIHLHSNTSHLQTCLKQKKCETLAQPTGDAGKTYASLFIRISPPNLSGDSCWHNYLHQRHGYYWTVMLDKIENIYIIHIIWLVSGLPSKTSSISNIDSIHVSFVVSVPLPLGGRTSIRLDLPSESLITRMIMARWVAQLVLREDKNLDILGPLEKHWYHPITGHSYLSHMLCANLFSE